MYILQKLPCVEGKDQRRRKISASIEFRGHPCARAKRKKELKIRDFFFKISKINISKLNYHFIIFFFFFFFFFAIIRK